MDHLWHLVYSKVIILCSQTRSKCTKYNSARNVCTLHNMYILNCVQSREKVLNMNYHYDVASGSEITSCK